MQPDFAKNKKAATYPRIRRRLPRHGLAMLFLYRKAIRCVGMGQHFSKNKKLCADPARDNHTGQGPTPPPSSREPFAIAICRQLCAGSFARGSCGSCKHILLAAGETHCRSVQVPGLTLTRLGALRSSALVLRSYHRGPRLGVQQTVRGGAPSC